MSWSWLIILWGLLKDVFTGPRPKSRIRLEVKGEDVIAQERKHLEELAAKVRKLQGELDVITQKALAEMQLINKHRGSFVKWRDLDCQRRLRARAVNDAIAEYDDAQRYTAQSG